ncbi:signaling peptide TAXIMIN 1-like [Salvia miltiorrhiza]|uniref:signaling peptide TAXIMIN 1-like n=1 Tax=Salvia miltiorrhiza TaxID=226208 RepID=UPI0025AC6421|nr:signaling peptide TAXIMIN 1-like [Salvia miltiorrhiza]
MRIKLATSHVTKLLHYLYIYLIHASLSFIIPPKRKGKKEKKKLNKTKGKQQSSRNFEKNRGGEDQREMCCGDGDCRPLGFLLGLPFAFLSLIISLIGILIWIVGLLLSCICPCCLCVTLLVEMALELIKAPIHVMEWFTSQIPC